MPERDDGGLPDGRTPMNRARARRRAAGRVALHANAVRGRAHPHGLRDGGSGFRRGRAAIGARGFGDEFKHSTGHGVGFAAIDHNAAPRLRLKTRWLRAWSSTSSRAFTLKITAGCAVATWSRRPKAARKY